MLDKKLDRAKYQSAQKRALLIFAIFLITISAGGLYYLLSIRTATVPSPPEASSQIIAPSAATKTQATDEADPQLLRQQFKKMLHQYEQELEPLLPAPDSWKQEELFEIRQIRESSLVHFSNGEYQEAVNKITLLGQEATRVIEESTKAFNEEVSSAVSFFKQDQYQQARFHINKALNIVPNQPKAVAFLHEIEKLPVILQLIEEAKTAQAENNLRKELAFQEKLYLIAPERAGVKERIENLTQKIREEDFTDHISTAFSAVEQKNIQNGWNHYKKAKEIYPDRNELTILAAKLQALEKQIRIQTALNAANQAIRRDDWKTALQHFSKAAKDAPQDKIIKERIHQAEIIVSQQQEISNCLSDPYRLSSKAVRNKCTQTVTKAEPVKKSSFSLQQRVNELENVLFLMNRLIPVHVISDQNTYIRVRGVGHVGTVAEKIIQLKPGEYIFEGTRTGYVSKLVPVRIPYDKPTFQLNIICDQPI